MSYTSSFQFFYFWVQEKFFQVQLGYIKAPKTTPQRAASHIKVTHTLYLSHLPPLENANWLMTLVHKGYHSLIFDERNFWGEASYLKGEEKHRCFGYSLVGTGFLYGLRRSWTWGTIYIYKPYAYHSICAMYHVIHIPRWPDLCTLNVYSVTTWYVTWYTDILNPSYNLMGNHGGRTLSPVL